MGKAWEEAQKPKIDASQVAPEEVSPSEAAAEIKSMEQDMLQEHQVLSKARIVTARYKVYSAVILLVWVIFYLNYYPSFSNANVAVHSSYDQTRQEIQSLTDKKAQYTADEQTRQEIEKEESTIKQCVNKEDITACFALPEWMTHYQDIQQQLSALNAKAQTGVLTDLELRKQTAMTSCVNSRNFSNCETLSKWMKGMDVPLSYLLTNSLFTERMPVDEMKVLININEYLIRNGISEGSNVINGEIASITIWDPKLVDATNPYFFQVPIDYTIDFAKIDELISFVRNVEKRLIVAPDDRILFKIQEIGYDIIAANQIQSTKISMIAYYYYNPSLSNVAR